ncbi:MAG: glucokinase, partial [Deltaproteobacteria bacterium]|nr:glucokinase [Deltaproteobacteria bacterium]
MEKQILLAGDIGGTKTDLALYSPEKGPLQPLLKASYPSNNYPGLDAIIKEFLSQTEISAAEACFGVAGPVRDGRAVITKLPWQPDTRMLQSSHNFSKVTLINDLVATGYAIPHLSESDLFIINEGICINEGSIGIIAPGTGLGEAIFTWEGSRYTPVPSEGGHTDFAPTTDTETALLTYMKSKYGHVSYDRVCSGRGLPDIYDFINAHLQIEEPDWLAAELAAAEDRAPIIVNGALDDSRLCSICKETLKLFVEILGAEAGNLALKGLTTCGMYLGGG